jgi:hypothetical protein
MTTFGRQVIGVASGRPVAVSADGAPEYKMGGVTVDWSTVTAAGSDTLWPDGTTVLTGQKALRFGQILDPDYAARSADRDGDRHAHRRQHRAGRGDRGCQPHRDRALQRDGDERAGAVRHGAGHERRDGERGRAARHRPDRHLQRERERGDDDHTDAYTGGSSPAAAIATTTQGTASRGSYGPYDPAPPMAARRSAAAPATSWMKRSSSTARWASTWPRRTIRR